MDYNLQLKGKDCQNGDKIKTVCCLQETQLKYKNTNRLKPENVKDRL